MFISLLLVSCKNRLPEGKYIESVKVDFFQSRSFKEISINNKPINENYIKKLFFDNGEYDFLAPYKYSSYIIYERYFFSNDTVFSFKEIDNKIIATYKIVYDCKASNVFDSNSNSFYKCNEGRSSIINTNSIRVLKHFLDSNITQIKPYKKTGLIYDAGASLFYFNGKEFYVFSPEFVNAKCLKQMDSIMNNLNKSLWNNVPN